MSNIPTIFIKDLLTRELTLLRCKCNGQSTQVQATKECISTFHSNDIEIKLVSNRQSLLLDFKSTLLNGK